MARRRKISRDGEVAEKVKSKPKVRRGKTAPVKWSIPYGAIAFVIIIVLIVSLMVTLRPVGEDDGEEGPDVPTELVRTFEASISEDSVFLLTGRNDTVTVTVNNTGDLDDVYEISVDHSAELDIEFGETLELDAGANDTINLTVGSVGTYGMYEVTVNITLDIPEDEANATVDNVTIENRVTHRQLDLAVYVSEYNLGITALDDHETAAPGENVTFVLEVENNGTVPTQVGLLLSKLTVDGGGKEKWTGATHLDVHQMSLVQNEVTHVRLNVTVPQTADPDGEVAHITITAESPDAIADGVPLSVSTQVHLTVSNIGFFGSPDAYLKFVQENRWVRFDCQIWNSGGTDINVKYRISEIPFQWEQDLQPYPDEGWYLGDDPVEFYLRMKPVDAEVGKSYRFIVEIYSGDTNETSSFSINVTVAEPDFELAAESQYIPIDPEVFDHGGLVFSEIYVINEVPIPYRVNLTVENPPSWNLELDRDFVDLASDAVGNFTTVAISFVMPANTTPGPHPFVVVGEAWGIVLELELFADVVEYRNGTVELAVPVPEIRLPAPPVNGSSNGTLQFNITNTGNTMADFEISVVNHKDLERPGWDFNLSSDGLVEDNRLVVNIDPGETAEVYLAVEVQHEHEGESIDPSLLFTVLRSPDHIIHQIDCVAMID